MDRQRTLGEAIAASEDRYTADCGHCVPVGLTVRCHEERRRTQGALPLGTDKNNPFAIEPLGEIERIERVLCRRCWATRRVAGTIGPELPRLLRSATAIPVACDRCKTPTEWSKLTRMRVYVRVEHDGKGLPPSSVRVAPSGERRTMVRSTRDAAAYEAAGEGRLVQTEKTLCPTCTAAESNKRHGKLPATLLLAEGFDF